MEAYRTIDAKVLVQPQISRGHIRGGIVEGPLMPDPYYWITSGYCDCHRLLTSEYSLEC